MNGLNSGGFVNGSGIREGRFEGSNATASNLAVTGSLLYYLKNWRIQTSAYYGGSVGLIKRQADSLQLNSGVFGTPVALAEANAQYRNNGISFRAMVAAVSIPDAFEINRAYANNTPSMMLGLYGELGYNFYELINAESNKNLTLFVRQEFMDLNYRIPANGIRNGTNKKNYTIVGLTFQPVSGVVVKADYVMRVTGERNDDLIVTPVSGVVVKADYVMRVTGERNDDLIVTPFPQQLPYYTSNGFFNLGFGYSF
jgi:hypothetical protein